MELTIDKRKKEINEKNNLGLSFWDLCFWQNNRMQVNNESETRDRLYSLIDLDLKNLYGYANKYSNFTIDSSENEFINRYFDRQVRMLIIEGRDEEAEMAKQNADTRKDILAQRFSKALYNEYKTLIETLKKTNYSPSFQCLILNEALSYTYQLDFTRAKPELIVNVRKPHKTILGLINLPNPVLDYIYENGAKYTSFKKLYTDAQVEYQNSIAKTNNLEYEAAQTFGKGHWVKFNGEQSDPLHFEENVTKLKAMVTGTPWCTNNLASLHLSEGDFYVFVGNDNKAHIAVNMMGNKINSVRGVEYGGFQEIENEYRDVVLAFLEKNKEFKGSENWIRKEKRNEQLIKFKNDIDSGKFDAIETKKLLDVMIAPDYGAFNENSNLKNLRQSLSKIAPILAQYFGCSESEICFDSFDSKKESNVCPYKVIMGNAEFEKCADLGNLKEIFGDVNFYNNTEITTLKNLEVVHKNLSLTNSKVSDLGALKEVGGDFYQGDLKSLQNLRKIGGILQITNNKNLNDLGELREVGQFYLFDSGLTNLGKIEKVGRLDCSDCNISSLGNVKNVGILDLRYSKVNDLGSLEKVEKLEIKPYQIKKADHLKEIKKIMIDNDDEEYINIEQFRKYVDLSNKKDNTAESVLGK